LIGFFVHYVVDLQSCILPGRSTTFNHNMGIFHESYNFVFSAYKNVSRLLNSLPSTSFCM